MTKKLLAFILSFALLLSAVTVVPAFAEDEITEWDGTVATGYAGGTGTKADPYLISSGAELAYMYRTVQDSGSAHSNNKYFKLTADIYLNDTTDPDWLDNSPRAWYTSVATNGYRFTGNFDGDGHTVYGIYYEGADGYQGLLPVMDTWSYDVTVKDLTVSDSFIASEGNIVGVISSRLYSQNYKTAHFYNINITDSVTVIGTGGDYVGGILGFSNCDAKSYYQFSGCAIRANISSGHALIGYGTAATVARIVQSYTTAADWYTTNSAQGETTYIIADASAIKGKEAAKAAMPNLDWLRMWGCSAEGYPFPYADFDTNNNKGLIWSGLTSADYAAGSGTEEDPYIIETAEQLARMVNRDTTTGKYYKLAADIKLNNTSAENWTDTAKMWFNNSQNTAAFGGHFDGAGYTISGIYYNGTGFAALIPETTGETSFKNIRISNSYLNNTGSNVNDHNVSGIVSLVGGAITFDRCIVDETVTLTSVKSVAGLAGYGSSNIAITNCGVSAAITGGRRPSAMISDFWGGTQTINNSYSVGTALTTYRTYTGANNYSTADSGKGPVTVLTEEQMKGEAARTGMPALKFFGATDTYPVIYQQGTRGEVWTGSIARDYAGGDGTKNNPYIIETGEQLVKLVYDANTAGNYYVIAADIKLNDTSSENWTATAKQWFGYDSAAEVIGKFAGVLDGEFNTISGLYYTGVHYYVGLFGAVGGTGTTINRVIIDNSYLETEDSAAAFTGYVNGAITYNDCTVGKNVTIKGSHASGYGSWNSGNVTVNNSMALANVQGSSYGGAFFADIWSSTLKISNSIGIGTFSPRRSYTGSNNYGTVADNYGVNEVEESAMQGADALTNMDALTGYYVTEGFPVRYYDSLPGAAWSGAISKSFASGSGTKANPYVIETAEQLARMLKTASKNMHYVLGTDITLTDENTSLNWLDSTNTNVFSGNFNGNGYIISGLYYDKEVTSNVNSGLIPNANGAYISNIVLEDSNIKMATNGSSLATCVGGIVGFVTSTNRTTLYSCYVADSVTVANTRAASTTPKNAVGGLIGGGDYSPITVDGCAFFGTLEGTDYRYGAVFGDIWGGAEGDRIIKYTITDGGVTPSSRWAFKGEKNISTVSPDNKDVDSSFTVVTTLKGDDGFAVVDSIANWNDRYFGTESYPMLSTIGKRYGDVDTNMVYDNADIEMIRKYLIGASKLGYIDVNGDGNKDIVDLVKFKIKVDSAAKPGGYELVWNDEFDGAALDDTKWSTTTRMSNTNELAQTDIGNVRKVQNGNLNLTAMENTWYNPSGTAFEQHKYMTTGSVTTENKMSYQYGYLEIRAKVPYKEGCWPSFWLRSHNATGAQENAKYQVEVDVFEVFGNKTSLASNLHQQNYNGSSYMTDASAINSTEVHTFDNAANLSNEYHIYAFEWEPDRMAIYVDGVLNVEWKLDVISLWRYGLKANNSGFDTTLNILFNNHLFTASSEYAPSSDNTIENHPENLPAEFDIDYVRLYQKNDGLSKLIIGE